MTSSVFLEKKLPLHPRPQVPNRSAPHPLTEESTWRGPNQRVNSSVGTEEAGMSPESAAANAEVAPSQRQRLLRDHHRLGFVMG